MSRLGMSRGRWAAAVAVACSLAMPAVASSQSGVTAFQGSYRAYNIWDDWKWWQPDKCTQPQPFHGSEPAAAGSYPVLVYLHGTLADWGGNAEGRRVAALAAAQGFVAAAITYDSWAAGTPQTVDANARCMFGGTSATTPLAQLCARPKADCSRGVVLSGFSAGGAIAARARNHTPLARAAWAMGVNGPTVAQALAAPRGDRALPDDRLRITIGRADLGTGGSLAALNQLTGQSCTSSPCLRADGSGYYVVGDDEVADGLADHCYWQSVNTWVPTNSCTWDPPFDPGFRPPSTRPWSLLANLEWLRGKLG